MKRPNESIIREWIETTNRLMSRKQKLVDEGFMEQNKLPYEGYFYNRYLTLIDLAICEALLGHHEPACEHLKQAVISGSMPFKMAFDNQCEYKDKAQEADRNAYINLAITHLQLLAMAALGDDALAQELVTFVHLREKDKTPESMEMVQTVEALRNILAHGDDAKSESLLKVALDHSKTHPIQGGWRRRTYTINLSLWAILRRDQHTFDEALALNLKDYEQAAKGEVRGTPEAYVSLAAVGLVKLARRYGLKYDGDHPLIPAALL